MLRLASRRRPARAHAAAALLALPALAVILSRCDLTVGLDGLQGGCPPTRGPTQVKIATGSRPFCIDGTEVTNAQYQQFASSGFELTGAAVPAACNGLLSPVLTTSPPSGTQDFPVTNVNWCQAYEYCKWAGKRLCGQIGGGPLDAAYFANAAYSQWESACTRGGSIAYPYGDTFNSKACGGAAENSMLAAVASQPACVGGVGGLYDMSGNVWEWTDACASGPNPFCSTMGGAFDSKQPELACVGERIWRLASGAGNLGFRCCLDL